jgi:siroheme synthase (precorrin-2 oxidase/ferrochelatase)
LREGALTVAVATAGAPALAAAVRDKIKQRLDAGWGRMAAAMQELRPWVLKNPALSQAERREIFRLLASDEAMEVLNAGDILAVKRWLIGRWPPLAGAEVSNSW